jgi:hypothetical protein
MLGTNDVRAPNNFTTATHKTNMTAIVNALVTAGFKVIIHKPLFTVPNANPGSTVWPNDPNTWYNTAFALDMQLVDGVNVFQGDTTNFNLSSVSPGTFLASDGIHPANQTQNTLVGQNWGIAYVERFGNVASSGSGSSSGSGGSSTATVFIYKRGFH